MTTFPILFSWKVERKILRRVVFLNTKEQFREPMLSMMAGGCQMLESKQAAHCGDSSGLDITSSVAGLTNGSSLAVARNFTKSDTPLLKCLAAIPPFTCRSSWPSHHHYVSTPRHVPLLPLVFCVPGMWKGGYPPLPKGKLSLQAKEVGVVPDSAFFLLWESCLTC